MDWLSIAIGFIGGIMFTILLFCLQRKDGIFHIDRSNPKKDICRLELNDLDSVLKKKILVLKVDKNANLSHR